MKVRGAPEQAIPSIRRHRPPSRPAVADPLVPHSGRPGQPLAHHRAPAGRPVRQLRRAGASLSLIGLYGVMSFVVTRRTRELGIRLALGATRASALRLVLRDAVAMIAAGMAIALPCVAALGKLVQSQLFGITATDPATVAAAALVLAAGAFAPAFIPAWRASKVSPTDALRLE